MQPLLARRAVRQKVPNYMTARRNAIYALLTRRGATMIGDGGTSMRLVAILAIVAAVGASAAQAADVQRPRASHVTAVEHSIVAVQPAMRIEVLRPQTRLTYRYYTPGGVNDPGGGTVEGPPAKRR